MKKQFLECGTSCRRLYWLMEVCEDWVASKGSFNSKLKSNCLKLGVMVVVMCVCACVHNCRALYISPKDDSIIFIFPHWLIDWQWHICIECIVIIFTSHHSVTSSTLNDSFSSEPHLLPLFMQASFRQPYLLCAQGCRSPAISRGQCFHLFSILYLHTCLPSLQKWSPGLGMGDRDVLLRAEH